jgi:hypothetical protein
MIIQDIANTRPPAATNDGLAVMLDTAPVIVPPVPIENTVCVCKCEYIEQVFSEVGAIVTGWKNDKTSMLFKKAIAADTITIKLYKGTTSYTITDNTYGTYYAAGSLPGQPTYVGFVADWNKIYNALGAGSYYFEVTTVIIGVTTVKQSIYYNLQPYSDLAADRTVRIETWNTGSILNSVFDYAGILTGGWYQSVRLRGKLMPKNPKLVTDNYFDQDYNLQQIQDKITDEYTLVTYPVPAEISNVLIYDNLLANTVKISDYNIYNEDVIRELSLYVTDIQKKSYNLSRHVSFEIKFSPKKDNCIKNNF